MSDEHHNENEDLIAKAIDGAEEVPDPAAGELPIEKPRLLVERCSPDKTIAALRDILSGSGDLYDRGVPVRLVFDQIQKGMVAQVMKPELAGIESASSLSTMGLEEDQERRPNRGRCTAAAPVCGHVPRLARRVEATSIERYRIGAALA